MKFTTDQKQFAAAIATVSRAAATKTSLPILTNILIEAGDHGLRLVATDLEIGITLTIPARVEDPWAVTVPGHRLGEWVGALDAKTLTLRMSGGRSKATLRGIDAEDFPALPRADYAAIATIDPGDLRQAVAGTAFAAAADQSRPVLAGVYCRFEGDRLTLSAADGFRMSVRDVSLPEPVAEPIGVIVPAKALQHLAATLGDAQDPIALHIPKSRNQMIARAPGVEFLTRLIDGSFPDHRQIFPQAWQTRTVVGREALLQAVKLAQIFAKENNHAVVLTIGGAPERGPSLTVSADAPGAGDNSADLDATFDGPRDQFALNGTFLAAALRSIRGAEVALESHGSNQGIVIRGVTDQDGRHIVMPMSLASYHAAAAAAQADEQAA